VTHVTPLAETPEIRPESVSIDLAPSDAALFELTELAAVTESVSPDVVLPGPRG